MLVCVRQVTRGMERGVQRKRGEESWDSRKYIHENMLRKHAHEGRSFDSWVDIFVTAFPEPLR